MSSIGSPIDTSLLQTSQAQQQAGKAKAREKNAASDAARRFKDMVDLKVAGVESVAAIRGLPDNSSEMAEQEQRPPAQQHKPADEDDKPSIDLKA